MLSDHDHDWAQGPRGVRSGLFPLYLWAWGGMQGEGGDPLKPDHDAQPHRCFISGL